MRILIADDDETLRELLMELLTRRGHAVIATENGEEALRVYALDSGAQGFDYVITDYQMPRKNGVALITEIRRCNPAQKCILVTGTPPQSSDIPADAGEFPILQKPYGREDLFALLK
jgi:two-component system, cell cycle response regulator